MTVKKDSQAPDYVDSRCSLTNLIGIQFAAGKSNLHENLAEQPRVVLNVRNVLSRVGRGSLLVGQARRTWTLQI